jgi:hypothetical protein
VKEEAYRIDREQRYEKIVKEREDAAEHRKKMIIEGKFSEITNGNSHSNHIDNC